MLIIYYPFVANVTPAPELLLSDDETEVTS